MCVLGHPPQLGTSSLCGLESHSELQAGWVASMQRSSFYQMACGLWTSMTGPTENNMIDLFLSMAAPGVSDIGEGVVSGS